MRNDWILDVLADLGEFAKRNQLDVLETELKRVHKLASDEVSGEISSVSGERCRHAESAGAGHRVHSEGQGA